jgi:hypothetical protein
VRICNVFAYRLRVLEAVTANAAKPLVAGEDVRTPLGTFRVVLRIVHFSNLLAIRLSLTGLELAVNTESMRVAVSLPLTRPVFRLGRKARRRLVNSSGIAAPR